MIRKTFMLLLLISVFLLVIVACSPSDDRTVEGNPPLSLVVQALNPARREHGLIRR